MNTLKLRLIDLVAGSYKLRKTVNPVKKVELLSVTPIVRTKQLMIKAQAHGQSSRSLYQMIIMFSQVQFSEKRTAKHTIEIALDHHGNTVFIQPLSTDQLGQYRCSCADYYFTWQFWNSTHRALFGRKYPKYIRKTTTRPERNPNHIPGLCKHQLTLIDKLYKMGLIVKRKS